MTLKEHCASCNDVAGIECTHPGASLAALPLESGWWRLSDATTDVVDCTTESVSGTKSACTGGGGGEAAADGGAGSGAFDGAVDDDAKNA